MKNKKLLLLMALTAGTMMASRADAYYGYDGLDGSGSWDSSVPTTCWGCGTNSAADNYFSASLPQAPAYQSGASDNWDPFYGTSAYVPPNTPMLDGAAPGPGEVEQAVAAAATYLGSSYAQRIMPTMSNAAAWAVAAGKASPWMPAAQSAYNEAVAAGAQAWQGTMSAIRYMFGSGY